MLSIYECISRVQIFVYDVVNLWQVLILGILFRPRFVETLN